MKTCSRCRVPKPVEEFKLDTRYRGGRVGRCRGCVAEVERARYAANLDAARERGRMKYAANRTTLRARGKGYRLADLAKARERERVSARARRAADPEGTRAVQVAWELAHADERREQQRAWREAHPGYAAARQRSWAAATPEKARASMRAADARRRGYLVEGDVTAEEWAGIVAEFGGRCAYCPAPWEEQDHVLALARGGRHTAGNVVPACASCNRRKSSRLLCDWLGFSEPGRAAA